MTLPVSLRAPSPRGRLRKKTGLGTGRREKRDDEMWERWTEERESEEEEEEGGNL